MKYVNATVILLGISLLLGLPKAFAHDCVALDDNTPIGTLIDAVKGESCVQYSAAQVPVKEPVIPDTDSCVASTASTLSQCFVDANQYDVIELTQDIESSNLSLVLKGTQGLTVNGNGYTILRTDNQRAKPLLDVVNSGDITFKDITLDDDARDPACVVGDKCAQMVYLQYSNNVQFINVSITNGKRYVVYTRQVNGFQFIDSKLTNSGVLGMYIGHDSTPSTDIVIDSSEFYDNSTNALALLGANNVTVTNNVFRRNHNVGQWPVSPQYGTGMTGGGQFYIAKANTVLVDSNTFSDGSCSNCRGGVHGIELSEPNKSDSVANVTITNNTLDNNTGSNIYTNSGAKVANLQVSGNVLDSTVVKPVEPVTNTPEPEKPVAGCIGACTAWGSDLKVAKALFAEKYPNTVRKDCDPVDGGYLCSSENIGTNAVKPVVPAVPSTPTTSGSLKIEAEGLKLTRGWNDRGSYVEWIGSTERYRLAQRIDEANLELVFAVPKAGKYRFQMKARSETIFNPAEPGNDIWFEHPQRGWIKAWFTRDGNWQTVTTGEQGHDKTQALLDMDLPAGRVTLRVSGRSRGTAIDYFNLVPQGFEVGQSSTSGDLIVLNYDAYPDTDDWQAVVMGKHIVDRLGLDPIVVVGAHGEDNITNGTWIEGSEIFWQELYPATLDAYHHRERAVSVLATAMLNTIQSGHSVYVAEGGPSDYTAQVLRYLLQLDGALDLKKVHVYQHSVTWNEIKTLDDNLAFVKSRTSYHVVADGNGPNSSADLQAASSEDICQRHLQRMKQSIYGSQWTQAFAKMGDSRKCDSSDTVELLAIVGDSSTRTFDDFYTRYVQ